MHTIMPARGTAQTEIIEYLVLNIIRVDQIPIAMAALDEKFHTIRNINKTSLLTETISC